MAGPADPKLAALLELERRGALTPDLQGQLQMYRAQGVTKTKSPTTGTAPAAAGDSPKVNAQTRSAAISKVAAIRAMRPQLARMKELYNRDQKGVGLIQSLGEYLPSQKNSQFDNSAALLLQLARQGFRVPGSGADSDRELGVIENLNPKRTNFDGANEEAFRGLERTFNEYERQYAPIAGMPMQAGKARAPTRVHTVNLND